VSDKQQQYRFYPGISILLCEYFTLHGSISYSRNSVCVSQDPTPFQSMWICGSPFGSKTCLFPSTSVLSCQNCSINPPHCSQYRVAHTGWRKWLSLEIFQKQRSFGNRGEGGGDWIQNYFHYVLMVCTPNQLVA